MDGVRTSSLSAGRLQILISDEWGTVCSNSFDIADADVACRQLGYQEAESYNTASNLGYSKHPLVKNLIIL